MKTLSKFDNKQRDRIFVQLLRQIGLPEPESEFRFTKERMWRFDFAYPQARLAIEIEGGVWNGGRHITGTGFEDDCEKYNSAALHGWFVLRIPTKFINKRDTFDLIKKCFEKHLDQSVAVKQNLF